MSLMFAVHPDNPQARLLRQAVTILEEGGLIVYPTDSGFAGEVCIGTDTRIATIG